MTQSNSFILDGATIPYTNEQTIIQAAMAAGVYIPHLCYNPEFKPHGSCKLCTVKIKGRQVASCTEKPQAGMVVESNTKELNDERRNLLQMLFVEGNHFCPSCEKSDHFYPDRPVDASHPDYLLDFNRCILCSICVSASRDVDGKNVFALAGRGINSHLVVNSKSGDLADTGFSANDKAAQVCPVGVILKKRVGFAIPIGERSFDEKPISATPHPTVKGA